MKSTHTLTKLAVVAAGLLFFSSCSKKEDTGLTNIMQYRNESSQAETIDATTITSDMTLEDKVNGVDYIISNNIQVNANLIIKPGVTVMFKKDAGIQVNESGSLTAIGASGNMVLFTSESGKRGDWKGITILSNSARNVISYCKIEHGGGANEFGTGDLVIGSQTNTGEAVVDHNEITASATDGIVLSEGSKLNGFISNKIHTNTACPISMHITDAGNMADGNEFVNNGKEFIKVSGDGRNVITKEISLNHLSESFLVNGTIVAGNKFSIAAGSRVYMNGGAEVVVDGIAGHGTFNAVGTAASPITIAATYNGNGLWNTIRFRSSDSNENQIEYCTISGGGANTNANAEGMISVTNDGGGSSNIVIRHSSIINSGAIGIYIESAGSEYNSDIISGNEFSNNVKGNVHIE